MFQLKKYLPITCLLLVLSVLQSLDAIQVGMLIPASDKNAPKTIQDLGTIHEELNNLKNSGADANNKNNNNNNKSYKLHHDLEEKMKEYLVYNSCLRYYLYEYMKFDSIEFNANNQSNVLVSFNIMFGNEPDYKIQTLNLNIMDEKSDTLRRKNNIHERSVRLLVDYPLIESSKTYFENQYLDVCFENLKVDQSWRSVPREIDVNLEISVGISKISEIYEKSSKILKSSQDELDDISNELDLLLSQLRDNLDNSETKLRNVNEDTNIKSLIFVLITSVLYFLTSIAQMFWLFRYLKSNNYL